MATAWARSPFTSWISAVRYDASAKSGRSLSAAARRSIALARFGLDLGGRPALHGDGAGLDQQRGQAGRLVGVGVLEEAGLADRLVGLAVLEAEPGELEPGLGQAGVPGQGLGVGGGGLAVCPLR